jgi:mycofactocin precursor
MAAILPLRRARPDVCHDARDVRRRRSGRAMTLTSTQAPADALDVGEDEAADEVLAEVLIEEISIDGMCGVY